jgi:serine/threonine protein phosphatase PrpC
MTSGSPNQDAWDYFHRAWGDGIVVSDGLGSKSLSNHGSQGICRAVERASRRFSIASRDVGAAEDLRSMLLADIRAGWLESIVPLDPDDCSATCLFAFGIGDGILRMGVLGDGCAAAVKRDGDVVSLAPDKADGFSNITSALSPRTDERDWAVVELPETECEAIVLCTDGISDDLEDVEGFMKGLVDSFRGLAHVTASRRARRLLEQWPVPRHSDDKTIACLYRVAIDD